ncbi:MAG: glycosyltransferase, partial [Gammaproteobacteria bacterium]
MYLITSPQVGIVIPVFNRKELTLRCLEKLFADALSNFNVIVVDSGSTDGTVQAVAEKFTQAEVLQTASSDWWAAATNAGIRHAMHNGCQFVLTCNDDNQLSSYAIGKLLAVAEKHPNSIVAATVCDLNNIDTVIFAGRRRSRVTDR